MAVGEKGGQVSVRGVLASIRLGCATNFILFFRCFLFFNFAQLGSREPKRLYH